MTIVAVDTDGLRYDIRRPCGLVNIFDGEWVWTLEGSTYSIFITFTENGGITLTKGWLEEVNEIFAIYKGTYEISLAENAPDNLRPGIISLDLSLEWSEFSEPPNIRAAYFINGSVDEMYMNLWISEGDLLEYHDKTAPIEYYEFWQPSLHTGVTDDDELIDGAINIKGFSDDELIEYLLSNVPEAYERVNAMRSPLEVLVPGDITEIPEEGICRNVWLVSKQNNQIELIILYTISDSGSVYEYDKAGDAWNFVCNPFAVG
jgi:hypothetical protein